MVYRQYHAVFCREIIKGHDQFIMESQAVVYKTNKRCRKKRKQESLREREVTTTFLWW